MKTAIIINILIIVLVIFGLLYFIRNVSTPNTSTPAVSLQNKISDISKK